MIHRVIEYVISCDAQRLLGKPCSQYGANAYGDRRAADCAASAEKDGWTRVTKRFWLCARCAPEQKTQVTRDTRDNNAALEMSGVLTE